MKLQRCYLYLRMHSMGRRLSTAHLFFYFFLELVRMHSLGLWVPVVVGWEKGQLISSSHNDGSVNTFSFFSIMMMM